MIHEATGDYFPAEGGLKKLAVRYGLRAGGLALMALAAALAVGLATWNVDDPSLSHVIEAPADNLLGEPGAAFADLATQLLGLAAIGMLLPLALVGWSLFRLRPPRRPLRQAVCWIVGTALLAAALACLPVLAEWPLPTGLGGAVGDIILRGPEWVAGGAPSGGLYAALAVVLGGLSAGLLWTACLRRPPLEKTPARGSPRRRHFEEDETEDDDERISRGRVALGVLAGALAHLALRGQAVARRSLRQALARLRRGEEEQDALTPSGRREPGFHGAGAEDSDPEDEEFDEAFAEIVQERAPASPTGQKVGQPPARPKLVASARKLTQAAPFPAAGFELPPLQLLAEPKQRRREPAIDHAALEQNARLLEGVLEDFGVRGEIINVKPGPVVTLYELEPAPGIKSSRVISLADDIARSMSAIAARVAVIPGRNVIGIELPNAHRETVFLRELLASSDFDGSKAKLALSLGKTIGGEPVIADLAKMPHLLVAGTTGSGKSVAINTMILALVYRLRPDQCRLIMIDPKMLELSVYDGIPHLLTPVVTDPKKAVVALKWTVREMEDRYKKMSKLGVRNIDGFNQRIAIATKKKEVLTRTVQTGFDSQTGEPVFETEELDLEPMPYIVVIIDEMADLMMVAGKDIEGAVQRLAQMARAAGIHVIMATQRPSVDVITGTIKANFPTRISFQVTSKIDSRTILGEQGAEQLLGQGDMLYMAGGGRIQRVHGPFVSDQEVENIVNHLKAQGVPDYLDSITDEDAEEGLAGGIDPMGGGLEDSNDLYDQAVAVVIRDRKASTSYIQRRLAIGYNRAASLIEKMEKEGVVGPANHAGKREILVDQHAA
jgi:S-DNA-T family DNA segregation ATPase FtsK/SpoIIIE